MKRGMQGVVIGIIGLAVVSMAAAQGRPTPVVRMGDWVEVGNEVFMNLIASNDLRYRTTHNYDFEDELQDRVTSRNPVSSLAQFGECDCLWTETRLGVDFRYQKNLTMRVLLEAQTILDGNLIDDRSNSTSPSGAPSPPFAGTSGEDNGFHIERAWIDYAFPGTPVRMRVGAHLWFHDAAGLFGDDDPGIFFFARLGANKEWELKAAAVIQQEASRLGLVNDNDNVYYLGTLAYNGKFQGQAYRLALDVMYQRDRFNGGPRTGTVQAQEHDYVVLMPNLTWNLGRLSGLAQFNFGVGDADGTDGQDYDIMTWAVVGQVELNLGIVRPLVGIIYAQGDDDPTDNDLEGFNNFTHNDIGLTGFTRFFNTFDGFMNDFSPTPARSALAPFGTHTVYNYLHDRLGNNAHTGIVSALSNPGTVLIPVGLKIFPVKQVQVNLYYMYVGLEDAATLERLAGRSIDESLWHEVGMKWIWTLNPHFNIQVRGVLAIPDDGIKDLAATVTCPDGNPCQGDDVALMGEVSFRGRF